MVIQVMNIKMRVAALLSVAVVLVACARKPEPEVAAAAKPPNIIYILADDLGYADVGVYGSEIPTPNLDALATGGVRCTQFYTAARCCPTRASLLTGVYPHQAGIGHMVEDLGSHAYQGELSRRGVTIAVTSRTSWGR
jgi:arylsulfatase